MNFTSIIVAVGVIQGVILSIALFRSPIKAGISNNLLALFCLMFSLVTFEDFLMTSNLILKFPHFFAAFYPFIFTLGPLFFLYVESLTQPSFRLKLAHILHFAPYLVLLALLAATIYFNSGDVKIKWIKESFNDTQPDLFSATAIFQNLAYIFASLFRLIRHKKNIQKIFSYDERINLRWLLRLVIGVISLWAVWGLSVFLNVSLFKNLDAIGFPVLVYMMGYWGIGQKIVYKDNDFGSSKALIEPQEKLKYPGSSITHEQIEEKLEMLLKYMELSKPFLKGDLSIQDLSAEVRIPVNQLSQIINGRLNQNFFEFVNSYRVSEFKKQVVNPSNEHLSLLGIALECGFNSKASFNAVFKKATGLTPSEYKKQSEKGDKTSKVRL
ncbi:helix-turn-helix domain-containing protein [Desertivirga brevis]|uniref:helix-turn-helix domain-containing protein n=1 Tax=Desertivirga brevis TaxID=2810310 RepID=UPI001A956B8E|nr:helix-turn-helix domain-containing protein [Pedobacter sp. SYSU D00873]